MELSAVLAALPSFAGFRQADTIVDGGGATTSSRARWKRWMDGYIEID